MGKPKPAKRVVKYANLDEMMADVDSLASTGYAKHGQWSLGQACGHVADWIRYPMDGYPKPPLFVRAMFGFMKITGMSKGMANKILKEGFKGGMPTAPESVPAANFKDEEGVAKLHEVVNRLKHHAGPLHKSPLFGPIDMDLHVKVTLLHAEHHFGYLEAT